MCYEKFLSRAQDEASKVLGKGGLGFNGRLLGSLFGDKKSVIRGGYSMVYDRESTIETVVIPMLGVGFGQTISSITPKCPTCTASSNPAVSDFRVGVDGNIPLPTVPAVSSPVVPTTPFGEILSFQDDPNFKVGRNNDIDLDIQREIPHSMLLELGYIGHWASRLPSSADLHNSPYMFKDPASGQTFAQAFDTVAAALRAGNAPSAQPFFENQLPGFATAKCGGGTNTACLISGNKGAFLSGLTHSLFQTMDLFRFGNGLTPYDNLQTLLSELRTYIGTSTYNAMIVSLQKKTSAGLTFQVNYTLSKSLDQHIVNQNNAGYYLNSYFPNASYGPSLYDRRHVFSGEYVYELPFGGNHRLHLTRGVFDRFISGIYWSGIVTAYSGLPATASESNQVWGVSNVIGTGVAAIPTVPSSQLNASVHSSSSFGGTGLNIFANPTTAFGSFRDINLSSDGRDGNANPFRGLGFWNYDMAVGKTTKIREKVTMDITAQFLNAFNHPNFATPGLSLQSSPTNFGEITSTVIPANRQSSGSR